MNYELKYLQRIPNKVTDVSKLWNFASGRLALIAQAVLHEADLLNGREADKEKIRKGREEQTKPDNAKKLLHCWI